MNSQRTGQEVLGKVSIGQKGERRLVKQSRLPSFSLKKFIFQKAIAKTIQDNNIPPDLVINLDQTPCYVFPGKHTFHFKGSKYVPVKGVDDKRQITAKFRVCSWRVSASASKNWRKNEMKFAEMQLLNVVHKKPLVQYLIIRGNVHVYLISVLGKG